MVAAGAIVLSALEKKGISVGTHMKELAGCSDRAFSCELAEDIKALSLADFPVLDTEAGERMKAKILEAREEGDSVGGVLECAVCGLPAGVGEPWFDSAESVLSHALFAIPGIKGVEFGAGFDIARMKGSEANDAFRCESGKTVTETNNNGGINGGITNGMPIIFRVAVKPTPSIFKAQKTVDIKTGENAELSLAGRHDPAIVHRARAVVDCLTAIAIADLLATHYGTDWLGAL